MSVKAKKGDIVVYGVETVNVYLSRSRTSTESYQADIVVSANRAGKVTRSTPLYSWPEGPLHRNDPWKFSDKVYVISKAQVDVDGFAKKYAFAMFRTLDSVKAALTEFKIS